MRKRICAILIIAALPVVFRQGGASALQSAGQCTQIKYTKPRAGAIRLRLDRIEGQAVFGSVSEKGEFASAGGLCVALFGEGDGRLVSAAATDGDGQFRITNVASGDYVLVASLEPLHESVVPVRLGGGAMGKSVKRRRLLLHMRAKEDRRKSFVTLVTDAVLREELLNMVGQDQAVRNELIRQGTNRPQTALEERMLSIDSRNTERLKEIVRRYGWPRPGLVGRDGADAAFLLLQHSPDLAFQKKMLPLVRRAYEAWELKAWDYALLLDRVLVREGKPQVYGMSVNRWEGKEPVLDPIEDETNVDKRRAAIGLPPLSEYLEFMKRLYFPQDVKKH
jgi:hypothetical protein